LSQSYGDRILGRNSDKSFKSFLPCYYSQSPLQLCPEISISTKSRNLLCISSNSRNLLCIYTVKLVYKGKQKGGKSVLRNPYRYLNSENSQDYAQKPQPQTSNLNLKPQPQTSTSTLNLKLQPQTSTSNLNLKLQPQTSTSTSIVRWASGHKILQNSITNVVCKPSLPEVALTFFQVSVVLFIQTESFWLLVLCKCQEKYSYFL
jgi:hypothetical protein